MVRMVWYMWFYDFEFRARDLVPRSNTMRSPRGWRVRREWRRGEEKRKFKVFFLYAVKRNIQSVACTTKWPGKRVHRRQISHALRNKRREKKMVETNHPRGVPRKDSAVLRILEGQHFLSGTPKSVFLRYCISAAGVGFLRDTRCARSSGYVRGGSYV